MIATSRPYPHSMYGIYNPDNMHRLTDKFEMHFLEVNKFKPQGIKEMKRLERWLAYLGNSLDETEMEEMAMNDAAIKDALTYEDIFMQDDETRAAYEKRQKAIWDYNYDMGVAKDEGIAIGRSEGISIGRNEGISIGRSEGIRGTVDLLREFGISDSQIVEKIAEKYKLSADEANSYVNVK